MFLQKKLLVILGLIISQNIFAGSVITSIFNIVESKKQLLVLSTSDGRIYRAKDDKVTKKNLEILKGHPIEIIFNDKSEILTVRNVSMAEIESKNIDYNFFQENLLRKFAPSDLKSEDQLNTVWESMNPGDKTRSQCFKRAHVWSFDMWSQFGINSEKIFIFYTKRHILIDQTDWWFHVAPMVTLNNEKFVMDKTFLEKPVQLRKWKDMFINPNNTCPIINKYDEFDKHQWKRLCYLMAVPMFHFSPADIEERDNKGVMRTSWIMEELQDAKRAFTKQREVYDSLDTGEPTITH
jgi:hypothetical protein